MTVPYLIGSDFVTVMVNGTTTTVREGQSNYQALRDAVRAQDWDRVPDLLTPARAVESFGGGAIQVRDGEVLFQGAVLQNGVTRRILQMIDEGFDSAPLQQFLERLMQNPSKTAVDELYLWLEGTQLPITEDGHFMAYKKVRDDYRDFYTGKVLNKPAELMTDADRDYIKTPQGKVTVTVEDGVTTLSMPRNQVDDNRAVTCSQGLHFCSLSYLPHYYGGQGRVLLVKIDPADVVSIPNDYDNAKGRAWRYQIVGEHTQGETTEAYSTPVAGIQGEVKASTRAAATAAPVTTVLGVQFETEERAAMVVELLSRLGADLAPRSAEDARHDGFDDAWDRHPADLSRFKGGHMREAVDYARAYFDSYDRIAQTAPAAVTPVVPTPPKGNPSLVGYNKGRSDAARGLAYYASSHYHGVDQTRYAAAYHKGFHSI